MNDHNIQHLGVIMDGNRRWARKNMLQSVLKGHEQGVDTFIDVCKWCEDAGIPYLTVYAFSTENWERAKEEVDGLFALMERFFKEEVQTCIERDIRMKIIGDLSRLSPQAQETVRKTMEETKHCKTLLCQVAISYGGRDEIVRAAKAYGEDVARFVGAGQETSLEEHIDVMTGEVVVPPVLDGERTMPELTEDAFSRYLDTAGVPDVDLVIRTGGNHRLSNFLPWQCAYAELYFTDTLWPDFGEEEFKDILRQYRDVQINKGR